MLKPIQVKPLDGYKIWIEYEDGESGEIDLSDLAGKGVFKAWDEPGHFEKVHISPHRAIAWDNDNDIDMCADALYMELTGKTWEELPLPQGEGRGEGETQPPAGTSLLGASPTPVSLEQSENKQKGSDELLKPIQVKPLDGYKIWIEYEDGESGEIDLSHLAGKGVFKAWDEPGHFEKVHIDCYGAIVWDENIDMCRYALYMEITGKTWEELPDESEIAVGHA